MHDFEWFWKAFWDKERRWIIYLNCIEMFDLVYIKVENNPSTKYYEKKQREVVIKASERYQNPSEEDEEKKP